MEDRHAVNICDIPTEPKRIEYRHAQRQAPEGAQRSGAGRSPCQSEHVDRLIELNSRSINIQASQNHWNRQACRVLPVEPL